MELVLFSSLIVILAVSVMGIFITIFLNDRFKDYLVQENRDSRMELVHNLSLYLEETGNVDPQWMERFSNVYMEQGMFISLNSRDGETMWSCMENNSVECSMHMQENNLNELQTLSSESYEVPLGDNGESTLLNISYIPDDQYSDNDLFFLGETYKILLISALLTLFISTISSYFLSLSISRPLVNLTNYAMRMAGHDYSAVESSARGSREIVSLHNAIEQLAGSLESQELLRKRLTADISHELRTPLTSLQTTLEAMIDGIWPAETSRLKSCHGEILRLTELVQRLDQLHKYDQGSSLLKKEPVKLRKTAEEVFRLFEKDLLSKNILWEVNGPDISISADEKMIKQIWINLLSNSLKFTGEEGCISFNFEESNSLRISFVDNGSGIDPEDIPNIFERFYKADSSRNLHGSGLGLSIVKEIVELHGGSISVVSEKNIKTEFIIELPEY